MAFFSGPPDRGVTGSRISWPGDPRGLVLITKCYLIMSEKKSKKYQPKVVGASEGVDYAVFKNANISRDELQKWIARDITGAYMTLAEILRNQEVLDAITEVYWKRYQAFHAAKDKESADINGVAEGVNPLEPVDPNQTTIFND